MKKYIIFTLLSALSLPLFAQHPKELPEKKNKDVTELVSDLSATQKRKIESISKESKARVDDLRKQQKSVHDSIALFMDREGDQSHTLYPLFERDAALKVAIDREMYSGKVRIDEVLTKEQRAAMRRACAKDKPARKSR